MSASFLNSIRIASTTFNDEGIRFLSQNDWVVGQWPIVYLISNRTTRELYIGESANTIMRMHAHMQKPQRKALNLLHIITSDRFNKSATLDVESFLIRYLAADDGFKLQNGNAGITTHNYYQKGIYTKVCEGIWQLLRDEGIAIKDLVEINNSDLFKYSPYKSLSTDQLIAVNNILESLLKKNRPPIFVEGLAGSGKTILAVYLMKLLNTDLSDYRDQEITDENIKRQIDLLTEFRHIYPKPNLALVVPMVPLRSTLKKVFASVKGLHPNMVISPSQSIQKNYDLLIVDEAHRMRRRLGIVNYKSFDSINNQLRLGQSGTELKWISASSKHQIFFYDRFQTVRPADIRTRDFDELRRSAAKVQLQSQHRVNGGNGYIKFVTNLLECNTSELKEKFKHKEYEFLFFKSFRDFVAALTVREKQFQLSRLVAGYAWKWSTKRKNSKQHYDIEIEGVQLKWNSTLRDFINSDPARQLKEVGCIHTSQGYDLNYGGVIFGKEITYDKATNDIIIDKRYYFDRNGKASIQNDAELKDYVINIYRTLLLRGIKGTFVYACDPQLQQYLREFIPSAD